MAKHPTAVALGRRTSVRKKAASAANGRKGGRPKSLLSLEERRLLRVLRSHRSFLNERGLEQISQLETKATGRR